jgi:hypothetical protein
VTHEVAVAIESLDPNWVGNFRAKSSRERGEVKFNGTVSYEGGPTSTARR